MDIKKTLIITHGRKGYLRNQNKHFSRPYLIGGIRARTSVMPAAST